MRFEDIYIKTDDHLKLKFFKAIIKQDINLQKQFMAFVEAENAEYEGISFDGFMKLIKLDRDFYLGKFKSVDLENPDWENYHSPHSGYIEEWEAYQYASEQEFERIFDNFRSEALDRIIRQKMNELTAMLIGLYEATQDANIPDEVGSFDNVNEYLLMEHTNTMNALIEKIRLSAVSENGITEAIELFFMYGDSEYPGNPHFAAHFEQLLLAVSEKSDNASQILTLIDHSSTERSAIPELVLLLNKKAGNATEWLQSANQFYLNNTAVAKQLLEYFFDSDKPRFIETARELFQTDNLLWAQFLQSYISPLLDEELFVRVFWQLTVQWKQIKHYRKIREYLSEPDFKKLLKEVEWDKAFIAEILELEKRYEDIKTLVTQNTDSWDYTKMIQPILTVYPEFCFENIKAKATKTIENERGRHVYERIASWLRLTQQIPGFENEKQQLIMQLYTHKPNLPALKDEMRKAGLLG